MTAAFSVSSSRAVVLDTLPLRIDRDEVLRFQGYKRGVDVPTDDVLALFDEAVALGEELMAPRLVYRAARVDGQSDHVIEARGLALHIPDIGRLWGPLLTVGAGVCTVGAGIETRVRELFDARELPLAVMLDSVGSAAVESLAEFANDLLCRRALDEGVRATNRISPGYAGWDTAEQKALWALCAGEPIGVTLNDWCFMTPAKSITFLVGIGPEARVDHYFTQCRRCWMPNCAFRRSPVRDTVHA